MAGREDASHRAKEEKRSCCRFPSCCEQLQNEGIHLGSEMPTAGSGKQRRGLFPVREHGQAPGVSQHPRGGRSTPGVSTGELLFSVWPGLGSHGGAGAARAANPPCGGQGEGSRAGSRDLPSLLSPSRLPPGPLRDGEKACTRGGRAQPPSQSHACVCVCVCVRARAHMRVRDGNTQFILEPL